MKPCRKCGATDRTGSGRCRPCYRAYYEANKDIINTRSLARYYADPARAIDLNRKWREENPETVKSARLKRYAENPAIRAKVIEWEKQHPERVREHQRVYREANSEKRCENTRRWRIKNPDAVSTHNSQRRARLLACEGSHTVAEWKAILDKSGRKCAKCRKRSRLEKDHIVPLSRGGTDFAYNLQPLCHACNIAKYNHIERGAQHSLFDKPHQ